MSDTEREVTPEQITELLQERHAGAAVEHVAVLDDSVGSANRLRLQIRYVRGCDRGLPSTMFLKRNLPRFSFPAEMYRTELRVYRDIVPGTGVEAPGVFAIVEGEGTEFVLLMEDLSQRDGVRIGHVLEPTTVDEVDSLLDTLATLHASCWGNVDRLAPWTQMPSVDPVMRFWREIGPRLTRRHLEAGHRAHYSERLRWSQDQLWGGFDSMLEADSSGPATFLHGDVHAGNVYYVAGRPGGLLDWQLSLRGCWALDVGYLLTSGLSVEDRRASELELIGGYLHRLRARGVDAPSLEEAWVRYRQNALYGVLMWLITPDGVHTDEAQTEYLERCLSAAEDLETLDSLAGAG